MQITPATLIPCPCKDQPGNLNSNDVIFTLPAQITIPQFPAIPCQWLGFQGTVTRRLYVGPGCTGLLVNQATAPIQWFIFNTAPNVWNLIVKSTAAVDIHQSSAAGIQGNCAVMGPLIDTTPCTTANRIAQPSTFLAVGVA